MDESIYPHLHYSLIAVAKDGRFIDCCLGHGSFSDLEGKVNDFADNVSLLHSDLAKILVYVSGYGLMYSFCKRFESV